MPEEKKIDYDFILEDLKALQRGARRNVEASARMAIEAIESLLPKKKGKKKGKK